MLSEWVWYEPRLISLFINLVDVKSHCHCNLNQWLYWVGADRHCSPLCCVVFGYYSNTVDAGESKQIENASNLASDNLRHIVALV